jgi:hypothetical protein
MAFWTIVGTGLNELAGKTFGVTLDTDKGEWSASGGSVDAFLTTKSGVFSFAGLPELGLQLVTRASPPTEVAFFTGLIASSAVGSTGRGRASEKGVTFSWKLDSK